MHLGVSENTTNNKVHNYAELSAYSNNSSNVYNGMNMEYYLDGSNSYGVTRVNTDILEIQPTNFSQNSNDDTYLRVFGKIDVNNSYVLPKTAGQSGEVLSYPAAGNELVWSTPAAGGANKIDDLSDALLNTSKNNLFLGHNASTIDPSNDYNVAVGITALGAITSGNKNTAVGHKSLTSNQQGEANTAIGSEALKDNVDGKWNTATGYQALVSSKGDNNVAFGFWSGNNVTGGDNNVFIGYNADASATNTSATNQIVIGANAVGNGNNTTTIGNNSTTNTYLKGDVNIVSGSKLGVGIANIGLSTACIW